MIVLMPVRLFRSSLGDIEFLLSGSVSDSDPFSLSCKAIGELSELVEMVERGGVEEELPQVKSNFRGEESTQPTQKKRQKYIFQ